MKLEPGETCDGTDLGGHTCSDLGFLDPAGLKCTACALDQSGCKAVCGNGKLEPGEECDDGNTANNDGCPSTCKFGSNQGTTCGNAIPISVGLGTTTFAGTNSGGGSHTGSTCVGSGAADRVYAITPQANGFLTISLPRSKTSYDSVLYVSQGCQEGSATQSLLCADSYDAVNKTPLDGGEVVSLRVQQGQKYYVFVDGYAAADVGAYQMVVDLSSGTDCNDPVPIPLWPGAPMKLLGSTFGTLPGAQGSCGGQPGGQIVYRITRSDAGSLGVATDPNTTQFNSVLYARSTCGDANTELACSNNSGNAQESISLANLAAGQSVYVYVDGSMTGGGNPYGSYGLTITP